MSLDLPLRSTYGKYWMSLFGLHFVSLGYFVVLEVVSIVLFNRKDHSKQTCSFTVSWH